MAITWALRSAVVGWWVEFWLLAMPRKGRRKVKGKKATANKARTKDGGAVPAGATRHRYVPAGGT